MPTHNNSSQKRHIIFCDGIKGGVGKTLMAMSAIDYLLLHDRQVGILDGDNHDSSVFRKFSNHANGVLAAFDTRSEKGCKTLTRV
jgi:cellulose biosynthesis protein BcsQ